MKVLLVHNYYQQPGGESKAVEAQVDLLRRHGHSVLTYTRDSREITALSARQKVALAVRTIWSSRTYSEVRSLVALERPDVAHVHNVFPLISPAVYRALFDERIPIVQTLHNYRFLCPNGLFHIRNQNCERCKYGNTFHSVVRGCYRQNRLLSAIYALSIGMHRRLGTFGLVGRHIALTEFAARKYVEAHLVPMAKVSVLGNFMPDPVPAPGPFAGRKPYVLFIGRLSHEKGLGVLLDAVEGLDLELMVLGDGPQAPALRAMAVNRGLRNVSFLGHVDGSRKWDLLREAMATVVPSLWYENMPFVVLESFAAGTPVVASNHGSLSSLIEEERDGLLFRPGDVGDLRAKLGWLAAHPQDASQMGRHARLVVETQYCAESHYKRLSDIYDEVRR